MNLDHTFAINMVILVHGIVHINVADHFPLIVDCVIIFGIIILRDVLRVPLVDVSLRQSYRSRLSNTVIVFIRLNLNAWNRNVDVSLNNIPICCDMADAILAPSRTDVHGNNVLIHRKYDLTWFDTFVPNIFVCQTNDERSVITMNIYRCMIHLNPLSEFCENDSF